LMGGEAPDFKRVVIGGVTHSLKTTLASLRRLPSTVGAVARHTKHTTGWHLAVFH